MCVSIRQKCSNCQGDNATKFIPICSGCYEMPKKIVDDYGYELMDKLNERGFIHEYAKTLKEYFENAPNFFKV